jgi:hypothetical protein
VLPLFHDLSIRYFGIKYNSQNAQSFAQIFVEVANRQKNRPGAAIIGPPNYTILAGVCQ